MRTIPTHTTLTEAVRYNWWTPEDKKQDISLEARMEYIMKHGTFEELRVLFRQMDIHDIEQCYQSIVRDEYHWSPKRRSIIGHLIRIHNTPLHAGNKDNILVQ